MDLVNFSFGCPHSTAALIWDVLTPSLRRYNRGPVGIGIGIAIAIGIGFQRNMSLIEPFMAKIHKPFDYDNEHDNEKGFLYRFAYHDHSAREAREM